MKDSFETLYKLIHEEMERTDAKLACYAITMEVHRAEMMHLKQAKTLVEMVERGEKLWK